MARPLRLNMKTKNSSAVDLGKRSAKARKKKLGKAGFSEFMRQLAIHRHNTAKNKA